jgi:hypothetical protein
MTANSQLSSLRRDDEIKRVQERGTTTYFHIIEMANIEETR